jgi:hypothetical protein
MPQNRCETLEETKTLLKRQSQCNFSVLQPVAWSLHRRCRCEAVGDIQIMQILKESLELRLFAPCMS